jgi:hypothetical protein
LVTMERWTLTIYDCILVGCAQGMQSFHFPDRINS